MKTNPLKIPVLLFSLGAAVMYIHHASRTAPASPAERAATPQKPGRPDATDDPAIPAPMREVSDGEVTATRELMLRSSKSGIFMSDDDIRRMLESGPILPQHVDVAPPGASSRTAQDFIHPLEPAEAGNVADPDEDAVRRSMMRSSKSFGTLVTPEDFRQMVQPQEKPVPRQDQENPAQPAK